MIQIILKDNKHNKMNKVYHNKMMMTNIYKHKYRIMMTLNNNQKIFSMMILIMIHDIKIFK